MSQQTCPEPRRRVEGQSGGEREAHIQELEREIADLKARWPKHSTPPAMLMRLEEL